MRAYLLFFLALISACTTAPVKRIPASEPMQQPGPISYGKSLVQIFPATLEDGILKYYFYLQLKDSRGNFVDCDPSEITLKNRKGRSLPFSYERLFTGRYYLILDATKLSSSEITFFVREKPLPGIFKLSFNSPYSGHSKVILVKNENHTLTLRLHLKDKDNRPVESPFLPELILDGSGELSEPQRIQEGIWEFQLSYPEENQVLYLSARSQGVYFYRIYRFHHIEK